MHIPLLTDWLQSLYYSLTNPQLLTHFCLPFPAYWSAYWSSPLLTDQLTHSLLICAYPLLTVRLQSPYCSLTNPLQILLTPLLSVFVILCFPHVYKAPWSSEEPRWNPPLNSMNLSLSQDVSLSLSLFFKSCRLQCKSKGFIIQVYSSLSSPSHFSRLKRSLGSLFSVSHHFWTSGAPLSTCCTNLQV